MYLGVVVSWHVFVYSRGYIVRLTHNFAFYDSLTTTLVLNSVLCTTTDKSGTTLPGAFPELQIISFTFFSWLVYCAPDTSLSQQSAQVLSWSECMYKRGGRKWLSALIQTCKELCALSTQALNSDTSAWLDLKKSWKDISSDIAMRLKGSVKRQKTVLIDLEWQTRLFDISAGFRPKQLLL